MNSEAPTAPDPTFSQDGDADDPLDLIAEDFVDRCRRGEAPTLGEYEARYPEHAERLRSILPAISLIEQLKRDSERHRHALGPASTPERLGEFRIVAEIGRGGMGVVYEAIHEPLDRRVALKVLPHAHLDARRLERFRREGRALAQLHHTNIVPIFAVGEHDGQPYYAMQFIRGFGLDVLLATWREHPRPADRWRLAARIALQAAQALHHAHDHGILHRDIKPANILLDHRGEAWVTDFGLAKLAGQDDLTATGDVIGTLRYLAPEALHAEADARSDLYSLGLTLYELLTLRPPFGDLTPSQLLHEVSEGQLARPRSLDPDIPRDLETIVLKATTREPDRRYTDAPALADDLRRFLDDRPVRARRASTFERAWRWGRRNQLTAALLATAAGALVLAAAVGWAGYVATQSALDRAETNNALSLQFIDDLFGLFGVEEGWIQPPPGRGRPRPAPDGPPAGNDLALLETILDFYERFARLNESDPDAEVQADAARAYRRVAGIQNRLGRQAEADRATAKGAALLESVIRRLPLSAPYRAQLIDTYIMADPWAADPATFPLLERNLSRAEVLAGDLPDSPATIQARVHIAAKRAAIIQRRGRLDDSEGFYRLALVLSGRLLAAPGRHVRARLDRAVISEALASLLIDRGRAVDARAALAAAEADLHELHAYDAPPPPLADHYRALADDYRRLGDPPAAARLLDLALRDEAGRPPKPEPGDQQTP